MTSALMNYTSRQNVENYLRRTFSEVSTSEFNNYLLSSEAYINNYLGYNSETTTSGILQESVVREKHIGKVDNYGNLIVDLFKPPVAFDNNFNPLITYLDFNMGGIRISLNLVDGTSNATNTLLEVPENRRQVIYPSLYFFPAISTVTPTAKVNLYSLKDVKFYSDISYIGGYAVVPGDIQQAANILTAMQVINRDNPNLAIMVKQGSMAVQYKSTTSRFVKGQPVNEYFFTAHALLQPYIRNVW